MTHELQLVGHPLQRGAGAVDVALEAVVGLAKGCEADASDQSVGGGQGLIADVHHDAGAGAVGHLAGAFGEAHLPDQCTVGVAQHAGNGDGLGEEPLDRGLAVDGIAGFHLGHHGAGNVEQAEQLVVPLHGVDVEEHGARGVGGVGGMDTAAGELPDEPCVDGAHQQLAVLGSLTGTRGVVEQPFDARR